MSESQDREKEHWSASWFRPKGPVTKEVAVGYVLRVYAMMACVLGLGIYISAPGTWQRFVYIGCLILIAIAFVYVGHWYVRNVVARSLLVAAIARLDSIHKAREARTSTKERE